MSEVLNIIDVNNYGLQKMKSGGGGGEVNLQSKDITINQNGTTSVLPDTGYDGLSDVDVTVSGILDTSDANATSNDIRAGKTAYINGVKATGSIPTHTYSGSAMGGKYTIAEQFTKGTFMALGYYIAVAPAIASDYSGSNFIVDDNKLRVGVPITVLQSAGNITADKVKVGQVIYGITGTFTSDADATASDILSGKTAYVNGVKVVGTYEGETPTLELYDVLDLQHTSVTSFDTDYIPNENTEIFVEYEDWYTYVTSANTVNLFGVRYGTRYGRATSSTWTNAFGFGSYNYGNFKFGNKELRTSDSDKLADIGGKIRLKLNKIGIYKYNYNTSQYETIALFDSTPTIDTMQHTIALFEEKQIMTIIDPQETYINHNNGNSQALKFHFMEIYENGVLKARYVPAKYGNEIGVYDTVAQKMLDRITPLDVYNEND